jgi:hypothetical protein
LELRLKDKNVRVREMATNVLQRLTAIPDSDSTKPAPE